jgi:hypothetical protein
MVFFWIAVGAFISSFVARWFATRRESPRARKFSASAVRGALEGIAGSVSSAGCSSKSVTAVGLEVKMLDEIKPVFMAWLGALCSLRAEVLWTL